jgi:hypothetical protein
VSFFDGGLSDTAGRFVDDATKGHVVARVVQERQVSEHVLDFLSLVEFHPLDHLVGDAMLAKGMFEFARQCVDPVEDGEVAWPPPAGADLGGNPFRNRLGFLALAWIDRKPHRRSFVVFGVQVLFLAQHVVCDQAGGHTQNAPRAAVIPLQPHNMHFGEVVFEIEDVAQAGPPPTVDRLVGVTGNGQVGMVDRHRPHDRVLGQVRVLVFVDQNVAVT